jgi:hypothetical protein
MLIFEESTMAAEGRLLGAEVEELKGNILGPVAIPALVLRDRKVPLPYEASNLQ